MTENDVPAVTKDDVSVVTQDDVIETSSGDHVPPCNNGKQSPSSGSNDEELSDSLKNARIFDDKEATSETSTSNHVAINASNECNTKLEYLVKGGSCTAEESNENSSDVDRPNQDKLDLDEEPNDCHTSLRSSNRCDNSNVDVLLQDNGGGPTPNNKTAHLRPSCESNCERSSDGKTKVYSQNEREKNSAVCNELQRSISNELSDSLQNESSENLNKKHGNAILESGIEGIRLGSEIHKLTRDSYPHYNGVVENECGDVNENEPAISLVSCNSENLKRCEDTLAYAKRIVDDAIEKCIRNIASILPSKEVILNHEDDVSFPRKNIENGEIRDSISLKANGVNGKISEGGYEGPVKDVSSCFSHDLNGVEQGFAEENTTPSSSSNEINCNGKFDEELDQVCSEPNSSAPGKLKAETNISSEFEKIDGCRFVGGKDSPNSNKIDDSCQTIESSPAISQPEASNVEKIREFSDRGVDNELNQLVNIRLKATKLDQLTENSSQEGASEFAKIENSENFKSNSASVEQYDTTTGHFGSEILRGNHSLGNMDAIKTNAMSVESCLKKFCSPEILVGDNMFICGKCNESEAKDDSGSSETKDDEDDDDDIGNNLVL